MKKKIDTNQIPPIIQTSSQLQMNRSIRRQSADFNNHSDLKQIQKEQYKAARDNLLSKVVPDEEINSPSKCLELRWKVLRFTTCMWRLCCCFYYIFCCCFCEQNKQVTKQNFVKRFGKWLNLQMQGSKSDQNLTVAKNLMRLYAHQKDAIEDLKLSRVNPDFTSAFRNDLEFFIPQLCSFFLKGNYEEPKELKKLIVQASSANFYFSHRVWFFFQSTMYQYSDQDIYKISKSLIKGLKKVCLENNEKLYIANSQDILNLIIELNLFEFYPHLNIDKNMLKYHHSNLSGHQMLQAEIEKDQQIDKVRQIQKIIKKYVDECNQSKQQKNREQINSQNIQKLQINHSSKIIIIIFNYFT